MMRKHNEYGGKRDELLWDCLGQIEPTVTSDDPYDGNKVVRKITKIY